MTPLFMLLAYKVLFAKFSLAIFIHFTWIILQFIIQKLFNSSQIISGSYWFDHFGIVRTIHSLQGERSSSMLFHCLWFLWFVFVFC